MMLVAASIFMLIFSLNLPTFYIDNFIFQFSFVVINIYLSIPLFNELIPPQFTDEQRNLYKSHFKKYLKPSEFKHLLSSFRRRVFKVNSSIVQRGNGFSSIFFIAKLPKKNNNCTIELRTGKIPLSQLVEYSWIGIVEYIKLLNNNQGSLKKALDNHDTELWGVDCTITFNLTKSPLGRSYEDKSEDEISEDNFDINALNKDDEVIIYEWDLEVFNK